MITPKRYTCTRCGFETVQSTNHYGPTWSWGRVNACPACPPWAKYTEYGGQTFWRCLEEDPEHVPQDTAFTLWTLPCREGRKLVNNGLGLSAQGWGANYNFNPPQLGLHIEGLSGPRHAIYPITREGPRPARRTITLTK
jgi:hypothetical protein